MSIFFDQAELWKKIPSLVSNDIEELIHERLHSGIETTPDETSNLIESFYLLCTRLWIAEALNIEKKHPSNTKKHTKKRLKKHTFSPKTRQKHKSWDLLPKFS